MQRRRSRSIALTARRIRSRLAMAPITQTSGEWHGAQVTSNTYFIKIALARQNGTQIQSNQELAAGETKHSPFTEEFRLAKT